MTMVLILGCRSWSNGRGWCSDGSMVVGGGGDGPMTVVLVHRSIGFLWVLVWRDGFLWLLWRFAVVG